MSKREKGVPCPECGSKGARHFKICSQNGAYTRKVIGEEDQVPTDPKALTEEQYDDLRDAMHDREFQSARYSLVNKLPPKEVNAAIRSSDYDAYVDSR